MSNTPKPTTDEMKVRLDEILADSVDPVDFWLKCDAIAHDEENLLEGMSQKKCRFCS